MQEMEQLANAARGLPPDQNSLHRLKALGNSGINIPVNNTSGKGSLPVYAAQANNTTMLTKQNHTDSELTNATIH